MHHLFTVTFSFSIYALSSIRIPSDSVRHVVVKVKKENLGSMLPDFFFQNHATRLK
jgi:hypothetical protein